MIQPDGLTDRATRRFHTTAGEPGLISMYPLDDTIAAIASPPGGAARGIVRISGPAACDCLIRLFQPDDGLPGTSSARTGLFPIAVARRAAAAAALSRRCRAMRYLWPDVRELYRPAGGGDSYARLAAAVATRSALALCGRRTDWRGRGSSRCGRFWPAGSI